MEYTYWLEKPAGEWEMTFPIGNGRLGASIAGNIEEDRVVINEESMWCADKRNRRNPQARENVGPIRKLLMEGKTQEAQFLCQMSMTGTPKYLGPYQTACDIRFHFVHRHEEAINYRRELNLRQAVTKVSYEIDGTVFTREYFVSARYQVIAMRFTAKGADKIKFQCNINRRPFEHTSGGNGADEVWLKGQCGDGPHYYSGLKLGAHDGSACQIGDYLAVWDATQVELYFDCETSFGEAAVEDGVENSVHAYIKDAVSEYEQIGEARLNHAVDISYAQMKKEHIEEYSCLFGTMSLELEKTDYSYLSMDKLLLLTSEEKVRRYITQMLFAFGRYLLISSSYQCRLPANLQGIWNGSYTPPWESKYTININLQMNYWMVDSCGLSECFDPFVKLLNKIVENGKVTAEQIYGCKGSVAHHNTDCYGNSDPEGLPASAYMWPMGEAWLSLHLYDHYRYTHDREFLIIKVMPILQENIRFFYDYLYRSNDGKWLTGPSVSPENTYMTSDGQKSAITMAPAMDNEILWELCTDYLEGMQELDDEAKTADAAEIACKAAEILDHLPPIVISEDGRIREWYQEYAETEKGHRHISHLFALHIKAPELMEAAQKTLKVRLENGGGHTGWSRAWLICMFARLHNGDKVGENVRLFMEKSLKANLYDTHPPFQIDGNFGFCAGVAEALAQTWGEDIYLLPAIAREWKSGKVNGLRLKGGMMLDMKWDEEEAKVYYRITAIDEQTVTIHYKENSRKVTVGPGKWLEDSF